METAKTDQIRSKELFKNTIIYAIGNFGARVLSFLIVPLYTYYLSPEEMGDYDLIVTTVSLLLPIITLQIGDAVYAGLLKEERPQRDTLKSAYGLIFCNLLIALPIFALIGKLFPIQYINYLYIILIVNVIYSVLQRAVRGLQNQKLFVISGLTYTIVFLALNVWQVVILSRGITAMFISAIIAYICGFLIIIILDKRVLQIKGGQNHLKEMLSFSAPLIPNQLNWWVMSFSDRYIIRLILGSAFNGIYSVAYKFPTVLQIVFSYFNNSWQDLNLSEHKENLGEYYSKIFEKYYVFALALLLPLTPASKLFIRYTMESRFVDAALYIGFLYLGVVFENFAAFYGVGYLKNGDTKGAGMTSIGGAIINIVVNLCLITFIGLHAAALSTCAGYLAMWLLRVIQTRNTMKIKVNRLKLTSFCLISFIYSYLMIYTSNIADFILTIVGGMAFLLSLYLMRKK